jgi:plastocyanin
MARLAYSTIAMLAILIAGFAFQPLHATLSSKAPPKTPSAQGSTVQIRLNGFVNGWNFSTNPNPQITINIGNTVSLTLVSSDAEPHQFLLDLDRDGSTPVNCPTVDPCSIQFTTSTSYSFTFNFAVGTFTYYCVVHPTTMFGSFVVTGNPPGGGGGHRVIL